MTQPDTLAKLARPECFDFAMDFLGEPESTSVLAYVELLERRALTAQALPAAEPMADRRGAIPDGIYYLLDNDDFYHSDGGVMTHDFYKKWQARCMDFPRSRIEAALAFNNVTPARRPNAEIVTDQQIAAGAAVIGGNGKPVGRNTAISVFEAMCGAVQTPAATEPKDEHFELWWADHAPKKNRDEAWAEWLELSEPARPDILERLTYHQLERDDLSLEQCLDVLASGWAKVRGRTDRQMVMQILALLAAQQAAQAPAGWLPLDSAPTEHGNLLLGWVHYVKHEDDEEGREHVRSHATVDFIEWQDATEFHDGYWLAMAGPWGDSADGITHWMPLPQPPQPQEDANADQA